MSCRTKWGLRLGALAALACGDDSTGSVETGPTTTGDSESGAMTDTDAPSSSESSESSGGSTGTDESSSESGSLPNCGDGMIQDGELCDDGPLNGMYEHCNATCDGIADYCGDGVVNGPEECDDDNGNGFDDCTNGCILQSCGDDVVQPDEICFGPLVDIDAGLDPGPLTLGDFDDDGALDLVVGNVVPGEIGVLLGDGLGGFAPPAWLSGPTLPHRVVATDFDDDGVLDVVAFGRQQGYVVAFGDGAGGLTEVASSDVLLRIGDAGNVDGDGLADLIIGTDAGAEVHIGLGDGTFVPGSTVATNGWVVDWLVLSDLDQDGAMDLGVAADEQAVNPEGQIQTSLGVGDGTFVALETHTVADDADLLLAASLDADTFPDLLVLRGSQPCAGANFLCIGQGGGQRHPTLGELTALVSEAAGGGGALEESDSIVAGFDPADLAAGDLDADGDDDALVVHFAFKQLELFRGDGQGGLELELGLEVGFRHVDIELGDLDGDGHPDIILSRAAFGNEPGAIRVALANP